MTLSAVALGEKQIVTPAVEVAAGELTPEQAYKQYHGLPCGCPHCLNHALESGTIGFSSGQLIDIEEILETEDLQEYIKFVSKHGINAAMSEVFKNPNSIFAKLSRYFNEREIDISLRSLLNGSHPIDSIEKDKRFVVSYRSESKDLNNKIATYMHFRHIPGVTKLHGCHDPIEISHWVACEVLKRDLKKRYFCESEYSVEREFQFKTSSGNSYIADVAVLKNFEIIEIFEVQRTYRGLRELKRKTEDVAKDFKMKWIFFAGAYRKMGKQRTWLSSVGIPYSKLFFENYRIIIEEGCPPKSLEETSSYSSGNKEPGENTCLYQEGFEENEPLESLSANQVTGIEFRQLDREADSRSADRSASIIQNLEETQRVLQNGAKTYTSNGAKKYLLIEEASSLTYDGLDQYEKFIVGRDVIGSEGQGIVTAVDFIFKKALVRRGEEVRWVSFDQFSIYT